MIITRLKVIRTKSRFYKNKEKYHKNEQRYVIGLEIELDKSENTSFWIFTTHLVAPGDFVD